MSRRRVQKHASVRGCWTMRRKTTTLSWTWKALKDQTYCPVASLGKDSECWKNNYLSKPPPPSAAAFSSQGPLFNISILKVHCEKFTVECGDVPLTRRGPVTGDFPRIFESARILTTTKYLNFETLWRIIFEKLNFPQKSNWKLPQ